MILQPVKYRTFNVIYKCFECSQVNKIQVCNLKMLLKLGLKALNKFSIKIMHSFLLLYASTIHLVNNHYIRELFLLNQNNLLLLRTREKSDIDRRTFLSYPSSNYCKSWHRQVCKCASVIHLIFECPLSIHRI